MLGRRKYTHAGMVFSDSKGTSYTVKACITIRQVWQVLFSKNIYDLITSSAYMDTQ